MSSLSESQQKPPIGVANIPNQIHNVASHLKVNFNILLLGDVNVGKTMFMNRLFGKDRKVFQNQKVETSSQITIREREELVDDEGIEAKIRIVDSPDFGYSTRQMEGYGVICEYVENQLRDHQDKEAQAEREYIVDDQRIHVCLYMLSPHQSRLGVQDIKTLKRMTKLTNVILVAPKADMKTAFEQKRLQEDIKHQIRHIGIPLFDGPSIYPISSKQDCFRDLESKLVKKFMPSLIDSVHESIFEQYKECRQK